MTFMIDPDDIKKRSAEQRRQNAELFKKLKKKKPGDLDVAVRQFHDRVFSETDCLACANCCKSISPMLNDRDIQRMASALRMRPAEFAETYLRTDEDHDYVFRSTPCPFLMPDNYCLVYEHRPKACREYPHTDRNRFHQILGLTLKNTEICPAALEIVSLLRDHYRSL